jgi:hypothetical protein
MKATANWKRVTKNEFDAFVASFPRPLTRDVTGICEPPMLSYNDFSGDKIWPESMVARVALYDRYGEQNKYSIRADDEPATKG